MAHEFELYPVLEDGKYVIQEYEEQLEVINEFIDTLPTNLIIESEDDFQLAKAKRTVANKYVEKIGDFRKKITKIVLSDFDRLIAAEKELKKKTAVLTENINHYKETNKPTVEEPETHCESVYASFTIYVNNEEEFNNVKKAIMLMNVHYEERKF